jgi:hypothetical protein
VERVANTLSDTIWNGSSADALFANYINGSNTIYRNRSEAGRNGLIYAAWVLLGGYSEKAQQAASYLLKAIVEGRKNPSINYNASSYGKVALSGHLLRNSVFGSPARGDQARLPPEPTGH